MKYCQQCGQPMNDDAYICNNCGSNQQPNGSTNKNSLGFADSIIGILGLVILFFILRMFIKIGITAKVISAIIMIFIVLGIASKIISSFTDNEKIVLILSEIIALCFTYFIYASMFPNPNYVTSNNASTTQTAQASNNDHVKAGNSANTESRDQIIINVMNQYSDALSKNDAKKLYGLIHCDKLVKKLGIEDWSEVKSNIKSFNSKVKAGIGMSDSADGKYSFQISNIQNISNTELSTMQESYKFVYDLLDINTSISITEGYCFTAAVKYNNTSIGNHNFNVIKLNGDWKVSYDTSFVI